MIGGVPVSDLTPLGLLLVLVLMLFTGWVVTKREHEDVKKQRDTWQQIAQTEQEHHKAQTEANRLMVDLLKSIKRVGDGEDT